MKRKVFVLFLCVVVLMTALPVVAAMGEEISVIIEAPVETPAETPAEVPVETPAEASAETPAEEPAAPDEPPVEEPVETPDETEDAPSVEEPGEAPELEEEPEFVFEATVRVKLENEGQVYYGDRVTLRAEVEANADYFVTWEYYNVDARPDENPWVFLANSETYSFDVNAENSMLVYRAVVNGEIASDVFMLMNVKTRPEGEPVLNPDRSIAIRSEWEGDELFFGDVITLIADLSGYDNVEYEIQWQMSTDGTQWVDIPGAKGATCALTVTEENYLNYWRVEVTVTGASEQ